MSPGNFVPLFLSLALFHYRTPSPHYLSHVHLFLFPPFSVCECLCVCVYALTTILHAFRIRRNIHTLALCLGTWLSRVRIAEISRTQFSDEQAYSPVFTSLLSIVLLLRSCTPLTLSLLRLLSLSHSLFLSSDSIRLIPLTPLSHYHCPTLSPLNYCSPLNAFCNNRHCNQYTFALTQHSS